MKLAKLLLDWYDANKRELAWRADKDPYKIWVSEVMLQQTRVEAVKPYFDRWLQRFPDLKTLAAADEAAVLQEWQGLGYYSRARNLLAGVREVVEQYDAKVPEQAEKIREITGIGEYTAGAILSIAYNKPEPAVDGNVLRVFSRLFHLTGEISVPAVKRQITSLVKEEMDRIRPGDFNQALMDLGATVCIPKAPRCESCPLVGICEAHYQGDQKELPRKKPKKAPLPVVLAAGVLCHNNRYFLRQRLPGDVLAGFWEFPAVELAEDECPEAKLSKLFLELGQSVHIEAAVFHAIHIFSHRRWDITFYNCRLTAPDTAATETAGWFDISACKKLNFAGPHRKLADTIIL